MNEHAPERLAGRIDAPVVLTCEHASEHLPEPWDWPNEDQWLVGTHWASDLGIAEITRRLASALSAPAVLTTFSRLLVDPNRAVDHPDLFRTHAEGRSIALNRELTQAERMERVARLYDPYHQAVGEVVRNTPEAWVLSMHSFTPVYEGAVRPMELAVLFDRDDAMAEALAHRLTLEGFEVAMNEPYSGKEGLIYSANRHATDQSRPALEIEIRQDLATDPARLPGLIEGLVSAISSVRPHGSS